MELQDSFFDSSSSEDEVGGGEAASGGAKVVYNAKRCEQNWFLEEVSAPVTVDEEPSIHSADFAISKHRADLFYFQKQYKEAAELYRKILGLVPSNNSCVLREITGALARCYLQLGRGKSAKREAEKLVLPPHERDWTAWMLLGQCRELLQEYEAQLIALQTSASLQRCHSHFWILLAEAYGNLQRSQGYKPSADGLRVVLASTVQLFRPYFTWRRNAERDSFQQTDELSGEGTEKGTSSTENCHQEESEREVKNSYQDTCCSQHCVFRDVAVSQDSTLYQFILPHRNLSPRVPQDGLTPHLSLHLCLHHSPFVMLVRQALSSERCTQLIMQDLCSCAASDCNGRSLSQQLLDSVCAMAQCSCLVWARQVLLYSVRHSQSFPKSCLDSRLREVEAKLDGCQPQTRDYVTSHFTRRTVFEEQEQQQ